MTSLQVPQLVGELILTMLPSVIAFLRGKEDLPVIVFFNAGIGWTLVAWYAQLSVLLGWAIVAWIFTFIWALTITSHDSTSK